MKVHIGKKIREAVKKSGMSVTEFAERINYSRRNIYSIFVKESMDTSLLAKISEVLKQDFFVHFRDMAGKKPGYRNLAEQPGETNYYEILKENHENRVKELVKEVEYLKKTCDEQGRIINSLMEIQVEKLKVKK